jgi:hypothetical protein
VATSGILGAVVAVWDADPDLSDLVPAGLWLREVSPGTALPHAVLIDLGTVKERNSERGYVETKRLRLEVFASRDVTLPLTDPGRPAKAVEDILARAGDVLDAGRLDVTGRTHMDLAWTASVIDAVEQRDPQGLRVYKGTMQVFAQVGREPPA